MSYTEPQLPPTPAVLQLPKPTPIPANAPSRLKYRARIMAGLLFLLVLVGGNLAISSGKLRMEKVISGSMEPTLMIGDTLLVDANGWPDRYSVVIVKDPEEAGSILVKRIIGMPGDTVKIQGGIIYLNGKEEYSEQIEQNAVDTPDMRVKVPDGCIFVMGDNRNNSSDSRDFGPVPLKSLMGTVTAVIWPPDHWCRPKKIH